MLAAECRSACDGPRTFTWLDVATVPAAIRGALAWE